MVVKPNPSSYNGLYGVQAYNILYLCHLFGRIKIKVLAMKLLAMNQRPM